MGELTKATKEKQNNVVERGCSDFGGAIEKSIAMADISLEEARLRMIQKRFGGNASGANVGGMRKNKGTHKSEGGMIDMNRSIAELVRRGEISLENAYLHAFNPKILEKLL